MEGTSIYCNLSSMDGSIGRIVACHAIDPGSIPGRCTFFEQSTKTGELDKLNFQQTRSNMVNQLEKDCMYGRNQYLLQIVKHRWFSGGIRLPRDRPGLDSRSMHIF